MKPQRHQSDFTIIAPLTYGGKKDCRSAMCRRVPWSNPDCQGWHCSYCDEPTSYQGHNCPAAEAIVGEAQRVAAERRLEGDS